MGDLNKFWTIHSTPISIPFKAAPAAPLSAAFLSLAFPGVVQGYTQYLMMLELVIWFNKTPVSRLFHSFSIRDGMCHHATGITSLNEHRNPPSSLLIPLSSSDVAPLQTVEPFLLLAPWRLLGHPLRPTARLRQCGEKWIYAWSNAWGNNISSRPCQPTPNILCPRNVVVSFHVISLYFYGRCRYSKYSINTLLHGASWSNLKPPLWCWPVSYQPRYSFFTDSCTSTAGIYLLQ